MRPLRLRLRLRLQLLLRQRGARGLQGRFSIITMSGDSSAVQLCFETIGRDSLGRHLALSWASQPEAIGPLMRIHTVHSGNRS